MLLIVCSIAKFPQLFIAKMLWKSEEWKPLGWAQLSDQLIEADSTNYLINEETGNFYILILIMKECFKIIEFSSHFSAFFFNVFQKS